MGSLGGHQSLYSGGLWKCFLGVHDACESRGANSVVKFMSRHSPYKLPQKYFALLFSSAFLGQYLIASY